VAPSGECLRSIGKMVHSIRGRTCWWQEKLFDPSNVHLPFLSALEVVTTMHYTNRRLLYLYAPIGQLNVRGAYK